ncbi:MAG TPA: PA14 domain-containing protein [Verrucomicrobiae bacterium]|nr:PA14 domain-containing protein [Verrucomicrobiae bacterium]
MISVGAWQMQTAPLMTDWAQQVDTNNPLPEYPRPQMVRSNWMNLNGLWQFQAGATNNPVPTGQTLTGEILVPFPMESAISGVKHYYPFSWYRRTFTVPAGWSGQNLLLHLDAVDWESEVFINGHSMGVHRGGYDPVTYDITPYVTGSGPQELIVRVYDPTDAGGQPRGKQTLSPGGIMYTSVSGIWQPVWLEPVPSTSSIASIKLVPDIDNSRLAVTANISGSTGGITVSAVARIGTNVVGSISGAPGAVLQLPVPGPNLWSPTNPFLYDLDVTLSNGVTKVDSVASYFGMRKVSIGTNNNFLKIFLNNQFVFEFGPLDQGFWPDGIYTAPTDLALKSDIEQEKALGWNMVRKHIKVERQRWYYWADKLGILVWQDMPSGNSYTGSPKPIDAPQFESELVRMVTNHWNSPAIVSWVIFNEGQGQHDTAALVSEVKALDPSRVVNQASGGDNSADVGDITDVHAYPDPGYAVSSTKAVVCGEYGGVGLGITNHTWAPGWGYVGATDGDDLAAKFENFSTELSDFIQNHGLSAAVYTEITDVETELNGMLTYDRKVLKPNLRRMQAAILAPLAQYGFSTVVASSQNNGQVWKYTTTSPATNWFAANFSDATWSSGFGGFGTAGTPGAVVRTTWNTGDIWLRRTFNPGTLTAQQVSNLVFNLHHDENVEIYLNGAPAYSAGGYTSAYQHFPILDDGRAALMLNANNTLAVHCHQTAGGQYIDVGLDVKTVLAAAPPLPPLPSWIENGTGLRGEYFNGINLNTPVVDRTDPNINFNWGHNSPAAGVSNELFSVRWTGRIQPRYSEGYTFHLTADDGCRLWINNRLVIDKWRDDSGTDVAGSMDLIGGQKYDIRVEYYEAHGDASARLEWNSASQTREVVPTGVLFASTDAPGVPSATNLPPTAVVTNRAPLLATPFSPLPLGSVRPQGWLLTQCQLQRDGLTGNAETVYAADLGTNSAWLGGTGDNWEKSPYYFKGLVPLAYVLNDAGLKAKAQKWMDWLLDHQGADGYLGPVSNNDWWPRMVATYALKDYYEATADVRVPAVLSNYFNYMRLNLPGRPLTEWGKSRAGDEMEVALWLYNRNGDTNLLTLVNLLRQQAYDWPGIMTSNHFMLYGTDFQPKHNVNVEQALKMPAVYYQVSKLAGDRDALSLGLAHLMDEHGLSCGINSGTEFLSGDASVQGVELCSIVEAMLSLETAAHITGDATLEDRLEKISFNALPAALTPDMKGLQYYTLPNNAVAIYGGHGYNQDYANGTLPGPDSGFPCCRFNFHMGWPKFVQNSWAATSDGGLAAMAYSPTIVNAMVAGQQVQITEDTSYPFEEQIRLRISVSNAVAFPLKVRIPGWCSNATVTVNGQLQSGVVAGTFLTLANAWNNGDLVTLNFPMTVQTETGPSRSISVDRGPLVYSLRIGENWTVRTPDPLASGFNEYQIQPTTPWNYALQLDPANPGAALSFTNYTTPANPFDPAQNPITLTASAKQVPAWTIGWRTTQAFEPPVSPVASTGATELVSLVPFGSQHLRVSWFPYLGAPAPVAGSFTENFDSTWSQRWTVFGGNWSVRNHTLSTVPASANGVKALATATLFTNFTYEADVSVGSVGNAGLMFRVSKPDIGADAHCGYYVGINAAGGQLEFGWASNSWHAITNVSMPIAANKFYHLKVQTLGSRIRIFVTDTNQPVIDINDSHFSGGMVGVRDYCGDGNQSISSYSNVVVKEFITGTTASSDAWYPLEGNVQDASGHGNDGAVTGTVTYPAGKLGAQAIQFSGGAGNYVTIPRPVSNDFTIAFWVKTTTTGGSGQWFNGKGLVDGEMPGSVNDFGVSLVGNNAAFGVGNPDRTIFSTNAINDGNWHHVTATRDATSGQLNLYLDGTFQATTNGATGTKAAAANLRIGALQTLVAGSFFAGTIDDVQFFSRAFGAGEVPSLMNHPPSLLPVFDTSVMAGRTLSVTNSGTDVDVPGQTLAYDFVQAPSGATINTNTGVLTWRPAISQAGTTHPFSVRLSDNGVPSMTTTQQFAVYVPSPARPGITAPKVTAGKFSMQIGGDAGPDYLIYATTNLMIAYANWELLANTNPSTLPFQFIDPSLSGQPQRFYRVSLGP